MLSRSLFPSLDPDGVNVNFFFWSQLGRKAPISVMAWSYRLLVAALVSHIGVDLQGAIQYVAWPSATATL